MSLLVLCMAADYQIEPDGQVDKTRFPEITFRFRVLDQNSTPVKDLPEQEITVLEDGQEVFRQRQRLQTEPATIVLVIDVSGSMLRPSDRVELERFTRGGELLPPGRRPPWRTKMDDAKAAAQQFFRRLDAQTPCGLILFNERMGVSQSVRREKEPLNQLVQAWEVEPQGGTALYDAVGEAMDLLSPVANPDRAIVVMTDGVDKVSKKSLETIIQRAREQHIRVYPVGLGTTSELRNTDPDIDERSLKQLAEQTGGQYHHVQDADKLATVFERVAGQLQDSYVVTFNSRRGFHDGTSRGIEIRFGDLAMGRLGYTTHGLITPTRDHAVYLFLLSALIMLLLVPSLFRRRRA